MAGSPLPVRTALEVLQLEFPGYAISQQVIGGQLFYLAEAARAGVQPRFAQAATTGRLRAKLSVPVTEFDPSAPSIPRVWDALLGGKDNFAPDRQQAARLLTVFPRAGELARDSREFQRRAVTHVAGAGVRQFLDLGCGLPTSPATHQVAQQAQPGAVVVYADNDQQVLTHAHAILARAPGVLAVPGDLSCPEEITYGWRVRQVISFHEPIAVVLAMTLHFFPAKTARAICAQLIAAIPAGSYLIVSAGQLDGDLGQRFTGQYQAGTLYHHSREDLAGFLAPLHLLAPGITDARAWQPPIPVHGHPGRGHVWAAVARKEPA